MTESKWSCHSESCTWIIVSLTTLLHCITTLLRIYVQDGVGVNGGARDLIIKWDPDPVGKTQPDGYVGATRWTIICSRGRDSIVNPVSPDSDSEV